MVKKQTFWITVSGQPLFIAIILTDRECEETPQQNTRPHKSIVVPNLVVEVCTG